MNNPEYNYQNFNNEDDSYEQKKYIYNDNKLMIVEVVLMNMIF